MWLEDLPSSVLDSGDDVPLHRQLSEVVRHEITNGALTPGTRLPTEADFQKRFAISRSVVRQAMASLTNEGLIQRGRGRGSVVAPQGEHHRAVQKMSGLSTQFSTSGDEVTTEVLRLEPESDPRAENALGTSELIVIERCRRIGGEPIAIIHTWLPRTLVPGLIAKDLVNASLHETLGRRFGVPVSAGRRQVRAVAASESLAEGLSVQVGGPLLVLEGTSCDEHGYVVEYFCTWHRSDRVVFDVDARTDRDRVEPGPTPTPTAQTGPAARPATDSADLKETARSIAAQMHDLAQRLPDGS